MKNKKLWIILFTLVLVLAACGQNQSSEKGHHSTHSTEQKTTDHNNNTHTYHRIISLIPSNTEILYRLGLGKNIIGVSTVDDYPKNVKKGKQQFDAMNLNKEALLKA
ncbi:ABC transporter substrate-binding protein, partial [Staphylococcus capitis]